MRTRALSKRLVVGVLGAGLLVGCKSDEADICERLDECKLLPKGQPTTQDPKGFQLSDCEAQVKNELNSKYRDKCANCVDTHACSEIVDACRAVCNPPY